jgi:hypothetical protein
MIIDLTCQNKVAGETMIICLWWRTSVGTSANIPRHIEQASISQLHFPKQNYIGTLNFVRKNSFISIMRSFIAYAIVAAVLPLSSLSQPWGGQGGFGGWAGGFPSCAVCLQPFLHLNKY